MEYSTSTEKAEEAPLGQWVYHSVRRIAVKQDMRVEFKGKSCRIENRQQIEQPMYRDGTLSYAEVHDGDMLFVLMGEIKFENATPEA